MRHKWVAVVAGIVVALAAGSAGAGAGVNIVVNGEALHQDVQPFVAGGIVLAEPRAVCEAIGARVDWDEKTQQLRVDRGGTTVAVKAGDRRAEVNGEPRVLQVPPVLVEGRLLAPIRFMAESLGAEVRWDGTGRTVYIDLASPEWAAITRVSLDKTASGGFVRIATNAGVSFWPQPSGPEEVVVDISGAAPLSREETVTFDDQVVSGVTITRTSLEPPAARVAVKLKLPAECRVEGSDREVRIAFNHQVLSVAAESLGGKEGLTILATGPVGFSAARYENPERVIVDIPGARVAPSCRVAPGKGEVVGPVTVRERRDPEGARVVVELKCPAAFKAWSEGDGVRLVFQSVVQDVRAERTGQVTRVMLRTTSLPALRVAKLPEPLRLVVDLEETNLGMASRAFTLSEGLVRQIHLAELEAGDGTVTRVSLLLDNYLGHRLVKEGDSRGVVIEILEVPLRGKVVVLDPGHGGAEPGAVGERGVREKHINLDIAVRLRDLLQRAGASVVMTREADVRRTMDERVRIVNGARADLALSIHANSFFREDKRGTETYSYPSHPASAQLALTVHRFLCEGLGLPNRGVRRMGLPLLKEARVPMVLIEPAYLSNDVEASLLLDPTFRARVAEMLQLAIIAFLTGAEVQID